MGILEQTSLKKKSFMGDSLSEMGNLIEKDEKTQEKRPEVSNSPSVAPWRKRELEKTGKELRLNQGLPYLDEQGNVIQDKVNEILKNNG